MDPENRAAVVTGASRGIGRRIVLILANRGYAVAANDLEAPEDTLEIENAGAAGISVPGDVSDEASVRSMAEAVVDEFGRVDVLVNNAGVSLITPAEETTSADWRRVLEVNLAGPFLRIREFGREMLR